MPPTSFAGYSPGDLQATPGAPRIAGIEYHHLSAPPALIYLTQLLDKQPKCCLEWSSDPLLLTLCSGTTPHSAQGTKCSAGILTVAAAQPHTKCLNLCIVSLVLLVLYLPFSVSLPPSLPPPSILGQTWLCSELTLCFALKNHSWHSRAFSIQGTIWGLGNQILIEFMQSKHPICFTIALAPCLVI